MKVRGKFVNVLIEDLKANWKCRYKGAFYQQELPSPNILERFLLQFRKEEKFYYIQDDAMIGFKMLFGKLFITSCEIGGAHHYLIRPGLGRMPFKPNAEMTPRQQGISMNFIILVKNGRVLGVDTGGVSGVRYTPTYYEEPPVGVSREEYQAAFDETLALFSDA